MKPILSHDLADASPMLETYADRVADALLELCRNYPDVEVCWCDSHDGYIVVVETPKWSAPRYVTNGKALLGLLAAAR
jgi:hypothetical protein